MPPIIPPNTPMPKPPSNNSDYSPKNKNPSDKVKLICAKNYEGTAFGGVEINGKKYTDKELLNYMNEHWELFDTAKTGKDGIAEKKDFEAISKSKDAPDEAKAAAFMTLDNSDFDSFVENRNNNKENNRRIGSQEISDATNDINKGNTTSKMNLGTIEGTSQGVDGDCFFLASINAMNQTPEGKQKLKEMITVSKDGLTYTVKFPGADKTYTVTENELKYNNHDFMGTSKTATGDKDVQILELAANKAFKDMGFKDGITNGGGPDVALELLSGQKGIMEYTSPDAMKITIENLEKQQKEHGSITAVAGFYINKITGSIKNKQNGDSTFVGAHAFTITNIDKDKKTITLHNPWHSDNKKEALCKNEWVR